MNKRKNKTISRAIQLDLSFISKSNFCTLNESPLTYNLGSSHKKCAGLTTCSCLNFMNIQSKASVPTVRTFFRDCATREELILIVTQECHAQNQAN